ncbi:MAG: purine-nucleoside phosphorylase [Ktedonobacteraceae bacterium]|nr:purine-nucleoside phosphorylase [Ktedonobacteraceae bacterium]
MTLYDRAREVTAFLQTRCSLRPSIAVILGSGLGDLVAELRDAMAFPYEEIPHFARSTVVGHAGRLLLGVLEGAPVVVMQGRFHFYEGYSPQELTLPVRVMAMLGAEVLIVSNAAGGVNPSYRSGDFMLIRDHIYLPGLAGMSPLLGPNDERFGSRFPPLAHAYDVRLRKIAYSIAEEIGPAVRLHEGVYTMVAGPSYETGAELKFLRTIGTDAVGMSTAPEVVVARHMGMDVLGISLITNAATGEETKEIAHSEVLNVAEDARVHFSALVRGIVREIYFPSDKPND